MRDLVRNITIVLMLATSAASNAEEATKSHCRTVEFEGVPFAVCTFDAQEDTIALFLNDEAGEPYGHFDSLVSALEDDEKTVTFAMNAGMYHKDRSPVGLYVEEFEQHKKANTNNGPGNFHLKPNGVFWIADEDSQQTVGVTSTEEFLKDVTSDNIRYATQSGPMLVIDGALHPRFLEDATSRKRRNGVGVTSEGEVVFVISDGFVTFHHFARLFRDELKADNALFLDGTISRLYAPSLDRRDRGAKMGPIVGVVESPKERIPAAPKKD